MERLSTTATLSPAVRRNADKHAAFLRTAALLCSRLDLRGAALFEVVSTRDQTRAAHAADEHFIDPNREHRASSRSGKRRASSGEHRLRVATFDLRVRRRNGPRVLGARSSDFSSSSCV